MDDGAKRIEDQSELAATRRQARRVQRYAFVSALVLTLATFAI